MGIEELREIPLTTYLDGSCETKPVVWDADLGLPEGTILIVSHPKSDRSYIFESTSPQAGKTATGFLSIIDDVEIEEDRIPAVASLLHPSPYLAQSGHPHVEFALNREDRRERIMPPVGFVDISFSVVLQQQSRQQRLTEELQGPFRSQQALAVLQDLAGYYSASAELEASERNAELMRMFSRWITDDFLKS